MRRNSCLLQKIQAPLPYFGGKSIVGVQGLGRWIFDLLPPVVEGQTYVEPFAGMLSMLLARPMAYNEVVNDLDGRVYNFWQCLRDEPDELARLLSVTPHCEQTYAEACAVIAAPEGMSDVKQAWAFVVAVGQGMMGIVDGRAWSTRRGFRESSNNRRLSITSQWELAVERVTSDRLIERIRNVSLRKEDGADCVAYYASNPRATIYCDPPYQRGAYGYAAKLDPDKLMKSVQGAEALIAISGYTDDSYNDLGWMRHDLELKILVPGGPPQERVECVWTNYDPEDLRPKQMPLM